MSGRYAKGSWLVAWSVAAALELPQIGTALAAEPNRLYFSRSRLTSGAASDSPQVRPHQILSLDLETRERAAALEDSTARCDAMVVHAVDADGTVYWSRGNAEFSRFREALRVYRTTAAGQTDELADLAAPAALPQAVMGAGSGEPLRCALGPDAGLYCATPALWWTTEVGGPWEGTRRSRVVRIDTVTGTTTVLVAEGFFSPLEFHPWSPDPADPNYSITTASGIAVHQDGTVYFARATTTCPQNVLACETSAALYRRTTGGTVSQVTTLWNPLDLFEFPFDIQVAAGAGAQLYVRLPGVLTTDLTSVPAQLVRVNRDTGVQQTAFVATSYLAGGGWAHDFRGLGIDAAGSLYFGRVRYSPYTRLDVMRLGADGALQTVTRALGEHGLEGSSCSATPFSLALDPQACAAGCLGQIVCGDGLRQGGEACDDGNTSDGDGCSSSCADEAAEESASAVLSGAEAVDTDGELDGATGADPIETRLGVFAGSVGAIAVDVLETPASTGTSVFALFGSRVALSVECLTAPCPSVDLPLRIVFRVDSTRLNLDEELSATVLKDGKPVAPCAGLGLGPDPCVLDRQLLPDGDAEFTILTSSASDWDLGLFQCPEQPLPDCRAAARTVVNVRASAKPGKDALLWKWLKGSETLAAELGDPLDETVYKVCVYGGEPAELIQEFTAPTGGGQWSAAGRAGFKYKGESADLGGTAKLLVKAGADGRAKAVVKLKGDLAPDLFPPLALPLTLQLVNSGAAACWSAAVDAGDLPSNGDGKFKLKK